MKTKRYFARISEDIKKLGERELNSFGAANIKPVYRGIYFKAEKDILYKIVFKTRFISRILAPVISFSVHSDKYLYKTGKQIEWGDFLSVNETFAINAIVIDSNIKHSKFAALRLKDAIADYFTEKQGKRPSVEKFNPDVYFDLFIDKNRAIISVDVSGGALHKRGYKKEAVEAPMSEILAAAIIEYSEWKGDVPIYDPFCGSGTLLCEAFIKVTDTPAGILRKNFGFKKLPDYDSAIWDKVKKEELKKIKDIPGGLISGSDISGNAVKISKNNCLALDKKRKIIIEQKDLFKIDKIQDSIIVCNPPYGIRMKKGENLDTFYKNLGDFLKQKCKNSSAYIYFGNREYIKKIGLRAKWKKVLSNGGLDGRLVRFDIY